MATALALSSWLQRLPLAVKEPWRVLVSDPPPLMP